MSNNLKIKVHESSLIPVTYYLDDMDSHDLDADPSHDESEFDVIDPPIAIYDNYYHGIFDK